MKKYISMLSALGQEVRLQVFRLLVKAGPEGACVEDILKRVRLPNSSLSHHLDTLARCGLLQSRREGRFIFYAVDWKQTSALLRFLTENCCAGLEGGHPEGTEPESHHSPKTRRPARRPKGKS
ncbi:MAG: winged helix-turn-helix transcriptional regulator [Acidobacteria bacterium]|nr:winged helix-turn-helix transcriptional regulator [Acidobacteriota bacterium]